ncbi:UNVERIFIED_CONTAM: hypothetical protein H355_004079, partial [Colinus virginianus]
SLPSFPAPPHHHKPLEDDFQFLLCEGCRQESPNLKLLTCLHTLCLGCLSENKPVGQCPVCRAPIPQPDGIPDVDNVLFASLQARLRVYRCIVSGAELLCDNCGRASEYWCLECKEFLCTKCFETHQRYVKRENHEAKRVQDIRVGSLQEFLEGTRRSGSSSCPIPTHQNQTLSIYCKQCCRAVCCICALLDAAHSGQHCDIGMEARLRQDELAALGQELQRQRGGFEASHTALQEEAARLEVEGRGVQELVRQRVEQLVRLIRHEEEELLALVERKQERGRRELAGELTRVEAALQRMEAGERLVEKMGLYATEQEVMDMQPFIKDALEELRRQQPVAVGELASMAALQEDFGFWARAHLQHTDELLGVATCLLRAQCKLNKHLVSLSHGMHSVARSLSAITSSMGTVQQPGPQGPSSVHTLQDPPHLSWLSLPSDLLEAAPAPATTNNSHQVPLASTPSKRKKDEGTITQPSPAKVIKVEEDDDEWSTPAVPQEPNSLPQPQPSFSAPTVADSKGGSLLNSMLDSSNEVHDSDGCSTLLAGQGSSAQLIVLTEGLLALVLTAGLDSSMSQRGCVFSLWVDDDLLNLGSDEEDSMDEELLDSSLLDDFSSMLEDSTSSDISHLPIHFQNTLDVGQGSVVFFDLNIWKNEIIQMAVVDKEKILSVLIQPMICLPNSMAKTNGCEVGLRDLLGHLSTTRKPILAAFDLWSLPLPILLKNLTAMGKKDEFFSTVYGFLDVLPLIKEKVSKEESCKLKNLANKFLWRDLSNCSTMESASATKDLCEVLDIDLENKPKQLLKPAKLESFMSLQPLLDKRLLSRPSAQTLASHGIGLSELHTCFICDPARGLRRMCALVNAHRHPFEKKVRHLSKVKAYFQQQPAAASSQASAHDLLEATKTKQDC